MKLTSILTIAASVAALGLGAVGLALDVANYSLQDGGQKQQTALEEVDAKLEEQRQALQVVDGRKEEQMQALTTQHGELEKRQHALQEQQLEIDKGMKITREVAPNLLKDLAAIAVKDDKMKALLTRHGYNVQMQQQPQK